MIRRLITVALLASVFSAISAPDSRPRTDLQHALLEAISKRSDVDTLQFEFPIAAIEALALGDYGTDAGPPVSALITSWHADIDIAQPVTASLSIQVHVFKASPAHPIAGALVYMQEGYAPDSRGRGSARVELPSTEVPITHLMVSLYVPELGKYGKFEGTLRDVENFAKVHATGVDAAGQAQALQQQAKLQTKAAGATPVEVRLPIHGKVFKLEKILAVGQAQWFSYTYSNVK